MPQTDSYQDLLSDARQGRLRWSRLEAVIRSRSRAETYDIVRMAIDRPELLPDIKGIDMPRALALLFNNCNRALAARFWAQPQLISLAKPDERLRLLKMVNSHVTLTHTAWVAPLRRAAGDAITARFIRLLVRETPPLPRGALCAQFVRTPALWEFWTVDLDQFTRESLLPHARDELAEAVAAHLDFTQHLSNKLRREIAPPAPLSLEQEIARALTLPLTNTVEQRVIIEHVQYITTLIRRICDAERSAPLMAHIARTIRNAYVPGLGTYVEELLMEGVARSIDSRGRRHAA